MLDSQKITFDQIPVAQDGAVETAPPVVPESFVKPGTVVEPAAAEPGAVEAAPPIAPESIVENGAAFEPRTAEPAAFEPAAAEPAAAKPGVVQSGKYNAVPGPLGLAAASLAGKVALVTGAGRGIGREMALELGRRGAKVIVNYANSDARAEEVVSAIRAGGSDAARVKADVSDVDQIVAMFDEAVRVFGRLDIVCSNSGVVSFGHIKDVTPEEYDRVFNINTRGQFFVAREAYKHLEVGGRLILMGSITGQAKGVPKHAVYSGTKGAIETFVRCMAIGTSPARARRRPAAR